MEQHHIKKVLQTESLNQQEYKPYKSKTVGLDSFSKFYSKILAVTVAFQANGYAEAHGSRKRG